jgi:hypothetical protein
MRILVSGILCVSLIACNNNQSTESRGNADHLFLDYKISGEEGYDKLTILARFRAGSKEDETVKLKAPAKVELDGEVFPADSAAMTGAYYELNKPVADFEGKHTIVYTGSDKKKYTTDFTFEPLQLETEIPGIFHRDDVFFQFRKMEDGTTVRLLLTDTSFINDGINKLDTVRNGKVSLLSSDLTDLANGPIQLELIKEIQQPILFGNQNKGLLRISYAIRRTFKLEN